MVEVQQISATVSTSITTLWQTPLTITSTGNIITVYPPDAEVFVTSGSLGNSKEREKWNPGYVLRFENSDVLQAQQVVPFLKWRAVGEYFTLYPDPSGTTLRVTYDTQTGYFKASRPCYGIVLVQPYKYTVREYEFKPSKVIWSDESAISCGVAYATYRDFNSMGGQKPKTIRSCEIPVAGIKNDFEKYRIGLQTVITDKGEWHLPKDFDKDSYDPANAYGQGVAGPSKDNGWVRKEIPIEIGRVPLDGTKTTITRYPTPKLKGVAAPVSDLVLTASKEPPKEWTPPKDGEPSNWDLCGAMLPSRKKLYEEEVFTTVKVELKAEDFPPVPASTANDTQFSKDITNSDMPPISWPDP